MSWLAVEKNQVGEGLRGERWVLQQEVQLLEASGWVLLDVHQGGVVEGDGVELVLVPRWHVHECLTGSCRVFHTVLNGGLKVERLYQGCLLECLSVTDRFDFNALRVGADAKLWVLPDSLLNDISDVLEGGGELFELVVAKSDVVRNITLVAGGIERFLELGLSIVKLLLLVQDAALGDDGLARVGRHLRDQALGVSHFFKFILDVDLELEDLVGVVRVIDLLGNLGGLLVQAGLEEALGVVESVLDDVGVEFRELVVHIRGTRVVLDVEVAVGQQGKSRSVSWRELKLISKNANDLHILLVSDERVDGLSILTIRHSSELLLHFVNV